MYLFGSNRIGALPTIRAKGMVRCTRTLLGLGTKDRGGMLAVLSREWIHLPTIARVFVLAIFVLANDDALPAVETCVMHLFLRAAYFVARAAIDANGPLRTGAVHKARVCLEGYVEFSPENAGYVGVDPVAALSAVEALEGAFGLGPWGVLA